MSRQPARAPTDRRDGTPPGGVVLRTLADHRPFALIACCPACGRHVVLEHAALAARFGWDATLDALRRRMTCQRCGTRTGRILISHGTQETQRKTGAGGAK